MISSNKKTLVIVFVLLLLTSIITVGCKSKAKGAWVNTSSLPGNTFVNHSAGSSSGRSNSGIIYLGSDDKSSDVNFGPRDVSFEFRSLKR